MLLLLCETGRGGRGAVPECGELLLLRERRVRVRVQLLLRRVLGVLLLLLLLLLRLVLLHLLHLSELERCQL